MEKWILVIGLLAAALVSYPVFAGMETANQNDVLFNGFDFVEDSHSYAAYIHSGVEENILFLKDYSTSEPQEGRYIVLYFSLIALIVKLTGLGIDLLWNIGRILVILFLTWAVWKLTTVLFPDRTHQIAGTALVILGGGFGWTIFVFKGVLPFLGRLYSTEISYLGYTVFSFLFHPISMLALGFICLSAYYLLRFTQHQHTNDLILTSMCILIAFFNHPAAAVFGFIFAGLYLVYTLYIHRASRLNSTHIRKWWPLVAAGIIALVYMTWARGDPVYAFHQSYYLSWFKHEPLWMYPFSLGIPLLLAIWTLIRTPAFLSPEKKGLLVIWGLLALIQSQVFPAGLKYLYLLFPAVALLAAPTLVTLAHTIAHRFPTIKAHTVIIGIIIACCLSAPFITTQRAHDLVNQEKYFLTTGQYHALEFLDTQGSGVVLSDLRIGSMISWNSPQRPLYAHGFLTLDFETKGKDIITFFSTSATLEQKNDILEKYHITHIYYGPDEQKIGIISQGLALEKIYDAEGVSIFRVK